MTTGPDRRRQPPGKPGGGQSPLGKQGEEEFLAAMRRGLEADRAAGKWNPISDSKDEAEQTLAEVKEAMASPAMNELFMMVGEQLSRLIEVAVGYRKQLIDAGFTEEHAQVLATAFLNSFQAKVFGGR